MNHLPKRSHPLPDRGARLSQPIESLEPRIAPAIVTVSFVNGALLFTVFDLSS
jgi:hypothetical protein